MLTVLAKPDTRDYGSLPPENANYQNMLVDRVNGLKLGLLLDMGFGGTVEPAVRHAVERAAEVLSSAGAEVEWMPALLDIDPSDALDKIFAVRSRIELDHLPENKRADVHAAVRALCGRVEGFSAQAFGEATDTMEAAKARVVARTGAFDYVLSPTLFVVNFPADHIAPDPDNAISACPFTAMFNQTGQPVADVCCGFDPRGLPIGLQIIGKRFDDTGVLSLAHVYEARRGFTMQWPECADRWNAGKVLASPDGFVSAPSQKLLHPAIQIPSK